MILLLKLQHTTECGIPVLISPKNPLLKEIRRAVDRGGLTADGLCIAETFHLVQEALRSRCRVATLVASESAAIQAEQIPRGDAALVSVSDSAFRSVASTETSQGILALVEPPPQDMEAVFAGKPLVVVLDRIQDPGNSGAILRVAEAFGATGVLLIKGTVNPYNPKAVRASAGSVFRIPLVSGLEPNFVQELVRQRGVALYAAMPDAPRLAAETDFVRPCALVIGNEGSGVGPALQADAQAVRIATRSVESLNAAVAAGVLLYEAARQRGS